MSFINQLGPLGYIMFLIGAGILVIAGRKAYELFVIGRVDRPESTEHALTSILVLSTVIAAIGFLATFMGLNNAFESISIAGAISPAIIMGGVAIAIKPIIVGLLMFSLFSLVWFVLRYRFKQLLDRRMSA